jgi:hypothetical protein
VRGLNPESSRGTSGGPTADEADELDAADGVAADGAEPEATGGLRDNLRESYRTQLVASIGGWTGTLITAIPPVVFVIVNAIAGLRTAVITAISVGVLLAGYRLVRHQPTQQALSGLFAVVVASLIAARTGQARGYFLLGIWSSFAYAVPLAISIVVRRPLVGVLWEFLEPTPGGDATPWHRRRGLLRAYVLATLVATVLFLSRGVVQLTLYRHDATGWLAFARVAMGYPLYIAAVGGCFWLVSRTRRRIAATVTAPGESTDPTDPTEPVGSAEQAGPDGGLGVG